MDVALRFPEGLEVYTDAGFAPVKSTGRRSVSGTLHFFNSVS